MSNQLHFIPLHVVVGIQLLQIVTDDLLLVDRLAVLRLRLHLQRGVPVRKVIVLRAVQGVPVVMLSYPGWILALAVLLVDCVGTERARSVYTKTRSRLSRNSLTRISYLSSALWWANPRRRWSDRCRSDRRTERAGKSSFLDDEASLRTGNICDNKVGISICDPRFLIEKFIQYFHRTFSRACFMEVIKGDIAAV